MNTDDALIRALTEWFTATAKTSGDGGPIVMATIADALYPLDPGQVERLRSIVARDTALLLARNAATTPE